MQSAAQSNTLPKAAVALGADTDQRLTWLMLQLQLHYASLDGPVLLQARQASGLQYLCVVLCNAAASVVAVYAGYCLAWLLLWQGLLSALSFIFWRPRYWSTVIVYLCSSTL